MAVENEVLTERVGTLERRVNNHSGRMDKAEQVLAGHDIAINNICKYQDKQNGSLQRLEDRFNSFYAMLFVSLLGMVANLVLTIFK